MPASTIRIVGNDIILPVGGLVDGIDVGTAVPAAQADATTAISDAAAAQADADTAIADAAAAQATANAAAPAIRTISTTAPITGGGDLSANRTIAVNPVSNTSSGVAPQHAGATDVGKALVVTATGSQYERVSRFTACWGNVGAPAVAAGRFFLRTAINLGITTTSPGGEYPCPVTGTYTFLLTVRISGTKLATNSVDFEIYKNGVATGIVLTMTSADTVKQASGTLAVTAGDGINVRALQSGTESESAWNCNVTVSVT